MARSRDNARKRAQDQSAKRRNSAAHRALTRRAQKSSGARSAAAPGAADPVDEPTDAPRADAPDAPAAASANAPDAPLGGDNDVQGDDLRDGDVDGATADDEPFAERVPTSELEAPLWLAESDDDPVAGGDGSADEHADGAETAHDDQESPDEEPSQGEPGEGGEPADPAEDVSDEQPRSGSVPTRSSVFATRVDAEPAGAHSDDGDTAVHAPVDETEIMRPVPGADDRSTSPPSVAPTTTDATDDAVGSTPPWADRGDGPMDQDSADGVEQGAGGRGRRTAWIVAAAAVAVAVLYVGAQALLSNTVPRGTEVLGQQIGGMSTAEATGEVDDATAALESEPLELRAAEQSFSIPATDAGLGIDVDGTVAQVTGFTLAPERLWSHVAGGGPIDPVSEIDDGTLADAVETAAVQLDGPAQDAGVTVADGAVEVVPGRSSVTVDQESSAARIAQAWPSAQAIDLVAETAPPAVTDEDAAAFASELETETFAAPITLAGDDAEATIEPATIAAMSTVESGSSGLELVVDGQALAERIIEDNPDLTTEGENASVSFDDNQQIVIEEGSPGITIDGEALGDAVTSAARSSDRIGELPYTAADPEVSAEDLGLADFQEIVSSFDTPLTPEPVRTENLRVAAADVEGVVVQPDESFDLTEVLSPITEEEGYRPAHVIVNGILTNGMGGGLSQMATTAYNAGYFAGYEILDHRPHSVWFTRYPAGRESTIYTGSINVEFRNNTPYAAVFNSYIAGNRLHVDVWSTKHFEVTTSASPKTNVTEPGVKEVTADNCEAKGAGQPGFTITNTRTVTLDGEEVDTMSHTWTYKPDDAIECVSEDDED